MINRDCTMLEFLVSCALDWTAVIIAVCVYGWPAGGIIILLSWSRNMDRQRAIESALRRRL